MTHDTSTPSVSRASNGGEGVSFVGAGSARVLALVDAELPPAAAPDMLRS